MVVIINFQEYVKTKKKKDYDTKSSNILTESGRVIYFDKEDVSL